jgi:hypothetical protein
MSDSNPESGTRLFQLAAVAGIGSFVIALLVYLGTSQGPEPPPSSGTTSIRSTTSIDEPAPADCLAPELDVSSGDIKRGDVLRVEGCGFSPNDRVFGFIRESSPPLGRQPLEIGSLITNEEGRFALSFEVPSSFPSGSAVIQFGPLDPDAGSATVELIIR